MLVYHPEYMRHEQSPWHVESPDRLKVTIAKMKSLGYMDDALKPETASMEELQRVHKISYLEFLRDFGEGPLDPDTSMHPETFEIARLAVGGTVLAVENAVKEGCGYLALVRPPGHHAGRDYAGGFCYLNNIAIAANKLLDDLDRVAILDFDAHHGNGTCDIFYGEPRVLYISTHQYRIFPGTGPAEAVGEGKGEGFTVNIPFNAFCGDASFTAAMEEIVEPITKQFKPQAILVSLGVDAHYLDPLTSLVLSSQGYVDLIDSTVNLAKEICGGKLAITIEGGYHLPAVAEVLGATEALLRGDKAEVQLNEKRDTECAGRTIIERVKEIQARYWEL